MLLKHAVNAVFQQWRVRFIEVLVLSIMPSQLAKPNTLETLFS